DVRQRHEGRAVVPARGADGPRGQLRGDHGGVRVLHRRAGRVRPALSRPLHHARRGPGRAVGRAGTSRPKEGPLNDHILAMRSITKRFPGVTALKDVSLTVREGTIHAICGANGAGKSTLMKVLSGVEPAGTYEGEIHFRGHPVSFASVNDSEA